MKDIIGKLLKFLNLEASDIQMKKEEDGLLRIELQSPNPSRIIGWHGETLNALQHIVKSVIRSQEKLERTPFIVLDVDGYRKMQEEKVCKIAEQKADFVRRTGNRVALQPMSPYFRRIVHVHVANTPSLSDLTTESVGEGDYRQIVLKMKVDREQPSEELSPVISQDDGLENLDV
ncbi:MAG TPA: R3H domain-containing nucleic acid-binding protein [Candidatus Peribacteraceae bacterium]|nr:R3H domain-containing nucleic acid-binding protein [Candidatus Peribacteraceae bacterium]